MENRSFYSRRPLPVVKSSSTSREYDFDESLIDKILCAPDKINIPERYIPEAEDLPPEEERKRLEKAEKICRLLSKSNGIAPIPPVVSNRLTLSSKDLSRNELTPVRNRKVVNETATHLQHCSFQYKSEDFGFESSSHSQPCSPVRRAARSLQNQALLKQTKGASQSSANCDWSLAGVRISPSSST